MKKLLALFAICVCLGIVGIPTVVHQPAGVVLDADALHVPASNEAGAGNFLAGYHFVCLGAENEDCFVEQIPVDADPCVYAYGPSYMTGGISYGSGSVVSILDKYHACEWNPWN